MQNGSIVDTWTLLRKQIGAPNYQYLDNVKCTDANGIAAKHCEYSWMYPGGSQPTGTALPANYLSTFVFDEDDDDSKSAIISIFSPVTQQYSKLYFDVTYSRARTYGNNAFQYCIYLGAYFVIGFVPKSYLNNLSGYNCFTTSGYYKQIYFSPEVSSTDDYNMSGTRSKQFTYTFDLSSYDVGSNWVPYISMYSGIYGGDISMSLDVIVNNIYFE